MRRLLVRTFSRVDVVGSEERKGRAARAKEGHDLTKKPTDAPFHEKQQSNCLHSSVGLLASARGNWLLLLRVPLAMQDARQIDPT